MGKGSRTVSFVGRLSLSQRVLYQRFHCSSYGPGIIASFLIEFVKQKYYCLTLYVGLCPALPNPAHGQVTMTGRNEGARATYTCDPDYELRDSLGRHVHAAERTCESSIWNGDFPYCQRKFYSL